MPNTIFSPDKLLGDKITRMSRQELCELVSKLCVLVSQEVGSRGYRGGIYPQNISREEDGSLALGPARAGDWDGQELDFLAPELYWHGSGSAASDVYSMGLLLYYGVTMGMLPFEGQCEKPQLRRMNGEDITAPEYAGQRLGEIIAKATRFKAADRYQTLEELRVVLDNCVQNLYLGDASGAEAIFDKKDDDLDDIERIMMDIIQRNSEDTPAPAEQPRVEKQPESEPELLRVYEPAPKKERKAPTKEPKPAPAPAEESAPAETAPVSDEPEKVEVVRQPIPILTEEKNPELEPIIINSSTGSDPAVKYSMGGKAAKQERKPRRSPVIPVLIICAAMVITAIIVSSFLDDLSWQGEPDIQFVPTDNGGVSGTLVSPDPTPDSVVTPPPEPSAPAEPTYQVIKEDCSWTEAQEKCAALGGRLAVITSQQQLDTICALAEEAGVSRLWIGCHRENGVFTWEGGESVSFYNWASGEPTGTDSYDGAAEDYVMLWNHNGWAYNDSRNDPMAQFGDVYGGTMGYVIEKIG